MSLYERVIAVISKPPSQRNTHEIDIILPWLRKKSQLLQSMKAEIVVDIIRNCQHQKSDPDEVIITQGERGDCFYIIVNGKVSVFIDPTLSGEEAERAKDENKDEADEEKKKDDDEEEGEEEEPVQKPTTPKKKEPLKREKYGKFIIAFESGKSFGEIALISENNVRNASIITDEVTDFLVINRELYNRSLKSFAEAEWAEKRNFVELHPFFSMWPNKFKRLLEMSLRKEKLSFDSPIVRQGEPVNGLAFVLSGKAVVSVEQGKHKSQYPELSPFPDKADVYDAEWLPKRKQQDSSEEQSKASIRQETVNVRRRDGYAAAEKKIHQNKIDLCFISEKEVIGDVEMILGLPTHMQTVTCTANTELFILDSKTYERLIIKKNPSTVDLMKVHVEEKLRMRVDTQQGGQIALLRHLLFKMTHKSNNDNKRLPPVRNSKELPNTEVLMQRLLNWFVDGKAPLIKPYVPGSIYYRDIMQEKARIRENVRERRKTLERVTLPNTLKKEVTQLQRKPRSITALKEVLKKFQAKEDKEYEGVKRPKLSFDEHSGLIDQMLHARRDEERAYRIKAEKERRAQSAAKKRSSLHAIFNNAVKSASSVPDHTKSLKFFIEEEDEVPSVKTTRTLPKGVDILPVHTDDNDTIIKVSDANSPLPSPRSVQQDVKDVGADIKDSNATASSMESQYEQTLQPDSSSRPLSTNDKITRTTPVFVTQGDSAQKYDHPATPLSARREASPLDGHPQSPFRRLSPRTTNPEDRNSPRVLGSRGRMVSPQSEPDLHATGLRADTIRGLNSPVMSEPDLTLKGLGDKTKLLPPIIERPITEEDATKKPETLSVKKSLDLERPRRTSFDLGDERRDSLLPSLDVESWDPSQPPPARRIKFFNAVVRHNIRMLEQQEDFRDFESSDKSLGYLESRLESFNIGNKGDKGKKATGSLTKLKRFEVKKGNTNQPKPGGRVVVKKQRCPLEDSKFAIKDHHHIRYHMVSTIPDGQKYKNAKLMVQFMMEGAIDRKMDAQRAQKNVK